MSCKKAASETREGVFINTVWFTKILILQMYQLVLLSPYREGIAIFFYSFIGPVGHNIWWENSRNGSFGPKNDLKMQISPFFRSILGSKFGTIPSGGGQN